MTTLAVAVSLLACAQPGGEAIPGPSTELAAAALTDPSRAGLELARAAGTPDGGVFAELRGYHALLQGDLRAARRWLTGSATVAAYRAMADMGRPGGLARARSRLARAAAAEDAPPGVLFLASLAFHQVGRSDRAHALLARAVRRAPSVLHEAFAPDPAVALARTAVTAAPPLGRRRARLRMAEALVAAGRRGDARRLVAGLSGSRAAMVRWTTWEGADQRRAVAAAREAAEDRPEMALVVAEADFARGRSPAVPSDRLDDPKWRARRARLRARIALSDGRPADALDAARAAARDAPDDASGVALVVRALVATGQTSRARSFADVLLERRPVDVNPFRAFLVVDRADGGTRRARDLALRERAFEDAKRRLHDAHARRERILSAVRDADAGLGSTGLDAVRTGDPTLSLPVDLALAKYGRSGTARAARERVLAACAPHLRAWLERRGDWDRVDVKIAPYGERRTASRALSDADPGRCMGTLPRVGAPRRQR